MNRLIASLALLIAASLCGCGAFPPAAGTCSVTLTGALTGTFPCTINISSDGMKAALTVSGASLGVAGSVSGAVELPLDIHAQDYSTSDGFTGFVATSGSAVWNQSLHHTDLPNFPDKGSFLLHVSSTGDANHQHAKGTLHIEMPADAKTGASGSVTAEVTFSDSNGFSGTGSGGGSGGGGGGGSGGGTGGGSGSTCTVTVSGGLPSSTQSCTITGATSQGQTNIQLFNGSMSVVTALQYPGDPMTGMYSNTAPGTATNVSASVSSDNKIWIGGYSTSSNTGTFSVNITSVGTVDPVTLLRSGIHGTWNATIPAPSAGTSDVSLSATF